MEDLLVAPFFNWWDLKQVQLSVTKAGITELWEFRI